jgi:PmbA protein
MLAELDGLLERAAARGATGAEAYAEQGTTTRVKVFEQEVEQLTQARRKGVGLRVLRDGSTGYAFSTDLAPAALDAVADRALANAAVTDPDEHSVLPEAQSPPALDVFDPRLATSGEDDKIELALSVERAALDEDPCVKLVEDTVYADGDIEVFIASSTGVRGSFRENHCYVFAYVLAEEDERVETGLSFSVGRSLAALEPRSCGAEAAQRACRLLGATKCRSMKATVVLDPFVAASFVSVLSSALTAEAVQKGRSLFAPLLGEVVAGAGVELADDGLHPDGLASAPFDAEGVPCRRTEVIAAGALASFLHNTYTAHKAGCASTGNATRASYHGSPGVGPTNLVVAGAATPLADIVGGIERGVLVTNAVGVHSGANPISGQFSVGINGVLIESGRLAAPVREVTLAGDIVAMLQGIVALGDDARWIPQGSVLTPSIVIEGMSIAGT